MKVKFTTTIDEELLKAVKIRAIEENTSVARIIETLFIKYLNEKRLPGISLTVLIFTSISPLSAAQQYQSSIAALSVLV